MFTLILIALIFSGGLFFIFRYFSLILVLGVVIWFFRKFIMKDDQSKSSGEPKTNNWSRDYEKNKDTAYDNIEREFEEVDEEE